MSGYDMPSGWDMPRRSAGIPRRFDEYYRCYPIVMLPGPLREHASFGGKVFLPPSALEKLTRLHITYPMIFELINAPGQKTGHAGVLEFIAEEGKIYLPQWLMKTLDLEVGDLLQIKSTDLPPGRLIRLQAQDTSFLNISDPRAVLENAFRNFSCLTKGDIFTFSYCDQTYDMAVLEVKPDGEKHAVVTMETDLEVDFATPLGYEEPKKTSGTSTPRSGTGAGNVVGGPVHFQGTMAQSINYASIAPGSQDAAAGARAVTSNFLSGGHRLKSSKAPVTPQASTPVGGVSTNPNTTALPRNTNGPQPLRLPPGKLFFGYEVKPVRKREEGEEDIPKDEKKHNFQGQGQKLRQKKEDGGKSGTASQGGSDSDNKTKGAKRKDQQDLGKSLGKKGR